MEITTVDPERLSISNLNERKGFDEPDAEFGHIELDALTENVAEIGIVQPPLVRPIDATYKDYEVVIGQRRTLAAQEVQNFDEFEDIGEIPVIVVEWDDGEALAASIVENVDAFREEVGTADRARAIERLKELRDWSNRDVAKHLGVGEMTVTDWLEPIHPRWEQVDQLNQSSGTDSDDVSEDRETTTGLSVSNTGHNSNDDPGVSTLQQIRRGTDTPEESASVLQAVQEDDLSKHDVREAKQRSADSDEPMEQTVAAVAEEKNEQRQTARPNRVEVNITFTGADGEALRKAADDNATSPNQTARVAIRQYLVDRGCL